MNESEVVPVPVVPADVALVLSMSRAPDAVHIGYWRSSKDGGTSVYLRELEHVMEALGKIRKTGSCGYTSSEADLFDGDMRAMLESKSATLEKRHAAYASLPWPGDHVDIFMPWHVRNETARIMECAPIVARYMGCSYDRLNPENRSLGSGERAMVGYVWPEGLTYYVRSYGLRLPDHFIDALLESEGINHGCTPCPER